VVPDRREAEARKDFLTRDQALHRIAQAKFIDFGHQRILGAAAEAERQARSAPEWLGVAEWTLASGRAAHVRNILASSGVHADEVRDVTSVLCSSREALANMTEPIGHTSAYRAANWLACHERIAKLEEEKTRCWPASRLRGATSRLLVSWVETMREWSPAACQNGRTGAARARIKASGRRTSDWPPRGANNANARELRPPKLRVRQRQRVKGPPLNSSALL